MKRDLVQRGAQPSIQAESPVVKSFQPILAISRTLGSALVAEYQTQLPDQALLLAKLDEFYELVEREREEGE